MFRFAGGGLWDRESFLLGDIEGAPQARAEFLQRYYSMQRSVPPVVALDGEAEDMELMAQFLSHQAGKKVRLWVQQKGEESRLVELCRANACLLYTSMQFELLTYRKR